MRKNSNLEIIVGSFDYALHLIFQSISRFQRSCETLAAHITYIASSSTFFEMA